MQQLSRMRSIHPQMKIAYECEMAYVDRWMKDHPAATRPMVLDAGCGFQYGLVMHYRGRIDVFGVEMDEHVLQKNRDVTWRVVGDAMQLPAASGAFDLIFCRDVLEHLPDPLRTLREFARVLKPGGLAVITTVNVRNPGMWAIRLTPRWLRTVVRRASFGDALGDNAPTFHRANTPSLLRARVREAGLELEAIETWPTFLWYFRFLPPVMFTMVAVNGLLQRVGGQVLFGGMTVAVRRPA